MYGDANKKHARVFRDYLFNLVDASIRCHVKISICLDKNFVDLEFVQISHLFHKKKFLTSTWFAVFGIQTASIGESPRSFCFDIYGANGPVVVRAKGWTLFRKGLNTSNSKAQQQERDR